MSWSGMSDKLQSLDRRPNDESRKVGVVANRLNRETRQRVETAETTVEFLKGHDLRLDAFRRQWGRQPESLGFEMDRPADLFRYRIPLADQQHPRARSEERRVGKECRSRWSPY